MNFHKGNPSLKRIPSEVTSFPRVANFIKGRASQGDARPSHLLSQKKEFSRLIHFF